MEFRIENKKIYIGSKGSADYCQHYEHPPWLQCLSGMHMIDQIYCKDQECEDIDYDEIFPQVIHLCTPRWRILIVCESFRVSLSFACVLSGNGVFFLPGIQLRRNFRHYCRELKPFPPSAASTRTCKCLFQSGCAYHIRCSQGKSNHYFPADVEWEPRKSFPMRFFKILADL